MSTDLQQRWTELNRRQQRYLLAIFETDRDQEAHERGAFRRSERSRPAEVWRWVRYATEGMPLTDAALKARIGAAKLIDQGTGSTFNALERRGYIICRYAGQSESLVLDLKLTPADRKLARHGAGIEAPRQPVTGQLREWQWTALAQLYSGRSGTAANPWAGWAERPADRPLAGSTERRDDRHARRAASR